MKKIIFLFLIISIYSCKKENVDGILIGQTLLAHQSLAENKEMQILISKSLNREKEAIIELVNFPNGGAASAYDLGSVFTQIIYRIGENDFVKILKAIPQSYYNKIIGLIEVGLQYGDNNYDRGIDNKRLASEFPKLSKILKG